MDKNINEDIIAELDGIITEAFGNADPGKGSPAKDTSEAKNDLKSVLKRAHTSAMNAEATEKNRARTVRTQLQIMNAEEKAKEEAAKEAKAAVVESAFEYGVDSDAIGFDELVEEAEYLDLDEDAQTDQALKRINDQKAKEAENKKNNSDAAQQSINKSQTIKSATSATTTDKTNAKNSINLVRKRTAAENMSIDKKIDNLNKEKDRINAKAKTIGDNAIETKKEDAAKNVSPAKPAQSQLSMGGNVTQPQQQKAKPAEKKPTGIINNNGGVIKEADIVTLQSLDKLPEYNISKGKGKNLMMQYDITNQTRDKINSDNITHQKAEDTIYSDKVGQEIRYMLNGVSGDLTKDTTDFLDQAKKANDVSFLLRRITIELRHQNPDIAKIRNLKFRVSQALQVATDIDNIKKKKKR